jgi:hypothetical protein
MDHFTKKYREIIIVPNISYKVSIIHDNVNRWICYSNKEPIGKDTYLFTLIDNFQENYLFLIQDGKITTYNKNNKNIKILSSDNSKPDTIICYSTSNDALPLPDFVIDVLQTLTTNLTFEVIRRITLAFHNKINKSKL